MDYIPGRGSFFLSLISQCKIDNRNIFVLGLQLYNIPGVKVGSVNCCHKSTSPQISFAAKNNKNKQTVASSHKCVYCDDDLYLFTESRNKLVVAVLWGLLVVEWTVVLKLRIDAEVTQRMNFTVLTTLATDSRHVGRVWALKPLFKTLKLPSKF